MPPSTSLWMLSIVATSHPTDIGCDVRFALTQTTCGNSKGLKLGCLIKPLARKVEAVPTVDMTERLS
jgi:hypothetical protein